MAFPCLRRRRNASPRVDFPSSKASRHAGLIKECCCTSTNKWPSRVDALGSLHPLFCCLLLFRRYDNYKIGTFLLCRSMSRTFEVHVRQWDCGGHRSATACNCGVAAREGGDTVVLDTCNGHFRESRPQLAIKSTEASPRVKILKSYGGRKITVRGYLSTLVVL